MARLSEKVLAIANSGKEPLRMPGAMEIETEKGTFGIPIIRATGLLTSRLIEPENTRGSEVKEG